jgi:hypothetical protein
LGSIAPLTWRASGGEGSLNMEPSNKALQLTKPAQAMELCS